ncbi:MAG: Ig-like domain-containing protein [Isosphaeraceae bacterium]
MRFPVMRATLCHPTIALIASAVLLAVASPAVAQDKPDRPKIVQVTPADGTTAIDPVAEIRIRFDRPMDPTRMALEWDFAKGDAGFRPRGEPRYSAETHEFVIPVQLTPGASHRVTAGRKHHFRPGFFEGFESAGHVAAEPFTWSFTTAKPVAKDGPRPRLVSVSPPPDSEVARVTLLDLTFDRPMDPTGYGLKPSEPGENDRQLALIGPADYDPAKHRFAMRIQLPSNWNGEIALRGFRSREGVEAGPIALNYRTRRRLVSDSLQAEIDRGGQSSDALRQVVEKVREARRKLTSVSEEAVTTGMMGLASPDWYQRINVQGSRFAMQGDRKFLGEVDAVMGIPFRVGSDGANCWWRGQDHQAVVPFDAVAEKNVAICDAFDANGPADADTIIRDRKLQYLGEVVLRGRRCHRIRTWNLEPLAAQRSGHLLEWSIDAETFLPARVETLLIAHLFVSYAIDFTYSRVNQPIPDEVFRLEVAPGAPQSKREPEPLGGSYTRRFLNVKDGSDGRMSVRWGITGPKGKKSSGLN